MIVKKYLLFLLAFFAITSCGDSEEEKSITNAIYYKYKEEAISTDTYVHFEVPSIDIKDKEEFGDTIKYKIEFGIMEMYPDRNAYYKGDADLISVRSSPLKVTSFYYNSCSLKDLP